MPQICDTELIPTSEPIPNSRNYQREQRKPLTPRKQDCKLDINIKLVNDNSYARKSKFLPPTPMALHGTSKADQTFSTTKSLPFKHKMMKKKDKKSNVHKQNDRFPFKALWKQAKRETVQDEISSSKQSPASPLKIKKMGSGKRSKYVGQKHLSNSFTKSICFSADDQPDPLTRLIEAHNTQKVRFNLSRNVVNDKPIYKSGSDISSNTVPSTSSTLSGASNIKKFMRRILLLKTSEDSDECIYSKDLTTTSSSSSSTESIKQYESSLNDDHKKATSFTASDDQRFQENSCTSALIKAHIRKGEKAQFSTFRYHSAGKHYLQAMRLLEAYSYPETSKLRTKTLKLLNDVQHARRSLEHSCQIVKIGLKHEEREEHIKALKMYTIAYRIRRDALGKRHPSLPVLLNMLGTLQVKRGELHEAMQILKLALYGKLDDDNMNVVLGSPSLDPWTMSVTFMEMGIIYEKWEDLSMALQMYHNSLECVMRGKLVKSSENRNVIGKIRQNNLSPSSLGTKEVRLSQTISSESMGALNQSIEMEACLEGERNDKARDLDVETDPCGFYNSMFQKENPMESKNVNINVAMTLYYCGNLRRRASEFEKAVCAFQAAYRGMDMLLGEKHTNVAAILGNIGNCYKDMKKYDEAYNIYQKVLKIESLHFGVGHPEVIVTMHNIAMIQKCKGNYKEAISLCSEVLYLQQSHLGNTHDSVTATSSCLADVYEISRDYDSAIATYKEIISLKSQVLHKFHPDLGVLFHSCAMVYAKKKDFENASFYLRKGLRVYEYNKITDSRFLNVQRDAADIQAKLALSPKESQVTRQTSF